MSTPLRIPLMINSLSLKSQDTSSSYLKICTIASYWLSGKFTKGFWPFALVTHVCSVVLRKISTFQFGICCTFLLPRNTGDLVVVCSCSVALWQISLVHAFASGPPSPCRSAERDSRLFCGHMLYTCSTALLV